MIIIILYNIISPDSRDAMKNWLPQNLTISFPFYFIKLDRKVEGGFCGGKRGVLALELDSQSFKSGTLGMRPERKDQQTHAR